MLNLTPMRRSLLLLLLASLLNGCAGSSQTSTGGAGAEPPPASVSGQFVGTYDVPTPPDLAAAAKYSVERITWTVSNGSAELRYDLPQELLGSPIALSFAGSIDAAGHANLAGEAGTATCTMSASQVVCHEDLSGLTPLTPDTRRVAALAAQSYSGPAQDRIDVARLFSTDPIGIVTFALDGARRDDSL